MKKHDLDEYVADYKYLIQERKSLSLFATLSNFFAKTKVILILSSAVISWALTYFVSRFSQNTFF